MLKSAQNLAYIPFIQHLNKQMIHCLPIKPSIVGITRKKYINAHSSCFYFLFFSSKGAQLSCLNDCFIY